MLALKYDLTAQVFLLNVYRGHFGGKIFGLYCYCGEKVGERPFFRGSHPAFHHGRIKPEQRTVAFGSYNSEAFGVNAAFIKHSRKGVLGFGEFGSCLYALIIK